MPAARARRRASARRWRSSSAPRRASSARRARAPARRAAASASNLFGAVTNGRPVSRASSAATRSRELRMRVEARCRPPCRRAPARTGAAARLDVAQRRGRAARRSRRTPGPSVSGVASCRCVRPILTMSANACGLRVERVAQRRRAPAAACLRCASTAATCIAVGNTSFDDWPRLTSSFGCTRRASPRSPPSSSLARLASTSFTFMLVCVPEPVCQTDERELVVVLAGEHLVGGGDDRVAPSSASSTPERRG